MSPAVRSILERVASWPAEDQEELSEVAREIEARRSGVYRLSDEERAAIDATRRGPLASNGETQAFWNFGKLDWDEAYDYKTERSRK